MEENRIKTALEKVIGPLGYVLIDIKKSQGPDGNVLQVIVDRDQPIGLDDIVALSEPVSKALDSLEDQFPGAYTLDLTSLGAEKPIALEKLGNYVGSYVNLHLATPLKGENIIEGTLTQFDKESCQVERFLKGRKQTLQIKSSDIDKARLAIKF